MKEKTPASAPTLVLCLLFCPAIAVHGISLYILSLLGLLDPLHAESVTDHCFSFPSAVYPLFFMPSWIN